MFGTACSTCHVAAPKLNTFGEAFRLNGYRLPSATALTRRDEPVSLGAPEWDRLWPGAIRPSDLPGVFPLALRVVSDLRVTRDERARYAATYLFPEDVHLLSGAPLGNDVSVFFEGGWNRDEGLRVTQARVELQDAVPGLPPRVLDVSVGLQPLHLLTFADHHIDQAAREPLSWLAFEASEVEVSVPGGAAPLRSPNRLSLGETQAAVELNGLLGSRLAYGVGLSQGAQDGTADANGRKDFYYRIRYKLGGMDLTGRHAPGVEPVSVLPGQLLDRSLVLEHFGYLGDESTADAPQGDHRAFGVAARLLRDRWDVGAGLVQRAFQRPWSALPAGRLHLTSTFGKAEYLVLPWMIASTKVERLVASAEGLPAGTEAGPAPHDGTSLLPGVIVLLRQNVRLVVEAELFLRAAETDRAGLRRPHDLWVRLDVAF